MTGYFTSRHADFLTANANGNSILATGNEEVMKKIAATTEGEYFQAASAPDLSTIYKQLSTRIALEKKRTAEVTALFVAIGAVLALSGALLSMFWYNRIL